MASSYFRGGSVWKGGKISSLVKFWNSGVITIPGSIQKFVQLCCLEAWFSGEFGSAGLMVGFKDLRGLFLK